jgi:PAS domain S-box-containing protein
MREEAGYELLEKLVGHPWPTAAFVRVAIGLGGALDQLHARGFVHRDIKPANVLVNAVTGDVRLIGLGNASRLPRERQGPDPPEVIAGSLPYMAPEQTGRMNRSVDSRSDLYALGVTLYEMLTGALPFIGSDPLEWVHCHIARQPPPPAQRVAGVPAPLSDIVMKLLAKAPEERYQTAAGVEADLRRYLASGELHGPSTDFPLGEHDVADHLVIPEKLYGREPEIEALLAAFHRVVEHGTSRLVLVSGYSGIGKSSVVNELHKALVPSRGLFAAGKFDQYKRDVPYATLAQAFQSLVQSILDKSGEELESWRGALRQALGANGQLVVNLIPQLERIIGKQPPVADLPPQDAQNRFKIVFRRFLGVFARPEHPLALFLDDLQWLDAATLDLVEYLVNEPEVRHLLLVGAYRDNEIGPSHPFMRTLQSLRSHQAIVDEIVLAPLGIDDLGRLVADTLHCERERAVPLATLLHDKTAGNPFFATQFLAALGEEGLIAFDPAARAWAWDLARITARGFSENITDLMVGKLSRLDARTQEALKQLACLGNRAEPATLGIVLERSENEVHEALWEAVRAGLVFRHKGAHTFVHDRVHEAAYALIPEDDRAALHLQIGRKLAAATSDDAAAETIFDVVNHMNRAGALLVSVAERERVAELNLIAGRRAKEATAYASALRHFAAGSALLAQDAWQRRYALVFALELNRAECEYLTGELTAAEEHLSLLARRVVNIVDLAAVTCVRVALFTTLNRSDRAIDVCLEYLARVGVTWSPHPTDDEVRREYEQMWRRLGNDPIEALFDLPKMTDPDRRATMDVLSSVAPSAFFTDKNLLGLYVARMANLSLEHGNSDGSCLAYLYLGMILGPYFGNYQAGFRFGQLALDLVEKRGFRRFEARVFLGFGHLVIPWTRHLRTGRGLIRRAFETARETGDLTFAAYSYNTLITNRLASGDSLADVQREAESGLDFARKARFGLVVDFLTAQLGLMRTLRGSTPTFGCFDDGEFDERRFEQHLRSDPGLALAACWYWIRKLQARFHAADFAAAMDAATKAQPLLATSLSLFEVAEYHLYDGLARAASCDTASADARSRHVETIIAHRKQISRWAQDCPENFGSWSALLGAEIARLEGHGPDAERLYEEAIRLARGYGFVQIEALANELAARFYAARGFGTISHAYFLNARRCYSQWGADAKVRALDQSHPYLRREAEVTSVGSTVQVGVPVDRLDLVAVVKASQAISGEIVLERLIHTLMVTALEHAAAERAILILPARDGLRVEAEATTDLDSVDVRFRSAPAGESDLPQSILGHVVTTGESVILDDASAAGPFVADDYVVGKRARSILCLPLLKQTKLIGVLYVENNLASHAFTIARTKVLKLLASQAAISLENASLFRDLQRAERTVQEDAVERLKLMEFIPLPIFVLGPDGRYVHANQALLDYTGCTMADAARDDFRTKILHRDDVDRCRSETERGISNGTGWELEVRVRAKDGQYRWFLVTYNPMRNEQGRVPRWYGTGIDIDDRKRAEERVRTENLALREEVDRVSMFEEIVGASPALQAVLSRVSKVAPTESTVLLTGETGTGKELIARAIHKGSARASRAFVSVNCAAVPQSLIASELFGHEKGAFTGAIQRRPGRFEMAEGGTLFLDEVGELPIETQIALLRVLQEREFERVGGTRPVQADVRVIAATNRDLETAIAEGKFRSDLFYRLNVFPIEIPPLRERQDDIPMLVEYFIARYASQTGKKIRTVSKQTIELLQSYGWPGNIRELQNVIERSVIVCDTDVFSVDESWLSTETPAAGFRQPLVHAVTTQQKAMIEAALRETRGRVSGPLGAATRLGMSASTLESKIRSLGIDKYRFKPVST